MKPKRKKQAKPKFGIGIHDDMPAEIYHSDPAKLPSLSASIAHIIIAQSPYHAWCNHPRLNKKYRPLHNDHFDLGSAAHQYILENSDKSFAVINAKDYRTNSAKEERDAARVSGKYPILVDQFANIKRMAEVFFSTIEKNPDLRDAFKRGKPETTALWREDKIWLRSRFDWLTNQHDIILNYKTTENANPDNFIRGPLVSFGYDLQAAFYLRGLRTLSDRAHAANYFWTVQEIKEPYAVSIIGLGDQMAEIANRKVERAIEIWKECTTKKSWPGYSNRTAWAYLPTWAVQRYEEWEATQGLITSSEQLQ